MEGESKKFSFRIVQNIKVIMKNHLCLGIDNRIRGDRWILKNVNKKNWKTRCCSGWYIVQQNEEYKAEVISS